MSNEEMKTNTSTSISMAVRSSGSGDGGSSSSSSTSAAAAAAADAAAKAIVAREVRQEGGSEGRRDEGEERISGLHYRIRHVSRRVSFGPPLANCRRYCFVPSLPPSLPPSFLAS